MSRFIFIFIFSTILVQSAFSIDPQFEACQPKSCGNGLNISFPFWIPGQHKSYCGHPQFQVTCNVDHKPILSMSYSRYVVRNISYHNQSFLVANTDELNETSCPIPRHNVSDIVAPFEYGPNHINLYLFYNCTSVPKDYPIYPIDCEPHMNPSGRSFAAFLHDEGLEYVNASRDSCDSVVTAPVDMDGEDMLANTGYLEILRRGFSLEWAPNNCSKCARSGGHCGFENDKFICFCRDRPQSISCGTWNGRKKIFITAIVAGTLITVATIAVLCWYIRKKSNTSMILWKRKAKNVKIVETFLRGYGLLAPQLFKYKYVKKITNSFKDKIGQGGFGSVFKGKLPDGRLVAVKVLSETKGNGTDFINEVATISRTSHVNIVSLLGFCVQGTKRALIYEFMPNGSLEKFIYDTPLNAHAHLGWETLYKIAIGIARGLEYLHRGCNTRILHFDIKPHNILLDQDFTPKIADFGLSKLCHLKESQVSVTGARGTAGYIAPEMISRNFGVVSHKADVYSYGMMVLEMVGGRKNIDVRVTNVSEVYFPHWIYNRLYLNEDLGLHEINSLEDQEIAQKMILVGLWCIQIDSVNRPPMSRVLDMLEGSLDALQLPPKPFLTSPPREEFSSTSLSKV